MLCGSHTPRIDEWCQTWPDTLCCIEKDIGAYFTDTFDLSQQAANLFRGTIGTLEKIIQVTV